VLYFFKRLEKKVFISVCTRICDHRVTKSVCLKALPAIRVPVPVPVWYCAPGHVHTGDVCVGDTFSPMSRAQPPAIIFLADCCFPFMINIKGNKKCFTERCRCGQLGQVSQWAVIKTGLCLDLMHHKATWTTAVCSIEYYTAKEQFLVLTIKLFVNARM